ncbi:MAG: WD40 repeat domain-containing protein, partial [Anaerolineae bacterium]|nr:WD40 repeat domain-containing protein [Anaerolineae bacterium]
GQQIASYARPPLLTTSIAWSPDGSQIAYADDTGAVQVVSPPVPPRSPTQIAQFIQADSVLPLFRLDWNPTHDLIAISDGTASVRIVDANTQAVLNELPAFPFAVTALRWSDDGTRLAVAGEWSMQIWDRPWDSQSAALSLSLQVPMQLTMLKIQSIDWNGSLNQILVNASARVFIWDSLSGQLLRTIDPNDTPIESAAWSPDGTKLAWGNATGYVAVENLMTMEIGTQDVFNYEAALDLEWSPDGSQFAVGTSGKFVEFFSGSGRVLGTSGPALESATQILCLDWHPTANLLAVGNAGGAIEIWDTENRVLVTQWVIGTPVTSIAWSRDGQDIAYNVGNTLSVAPSPVVTAPSPISP